MVMGDHMMNFTNKDSGMLNTIAIILAVFIGFLLSLKIKTRKKEEKNVDELSILQKALSSDEIAYRSNLSRGTVVHHLNRLIESGLVVNHDNRYILRVDNLEELIEEIKKNVLKTLEDLRIIAEDLDVEVGLLRR